MVICSGKRLPDRTNTRSELSTPRGYTCRNP